MLPDDSFEAAVMAGDRAAADWLHGSARAEPDRVDDAPAEDEEPGTDDSNEPWLLVLNEDDRGLVREYMLANRYPKAAADSLDEWPIGELRHLLEATRSWKVREAQRAAERAEAEQQLQELETRRVESRLVLDRLYRDQADTLLSRDQDKSIMVLSAREARRSRTGNCLQGNQGLDLERQIHKAAAERGFAIGQPHWDRASGKLFIDLFHLGAEPWWDTGQASGLVLIPPHGKLLESKRRYRALYPFQRAAVNAAFVNRANHIDARSECQSADKMQQRRQMTTLPSTETEADPVTVAVPTSGPAPEQTAAEAATPHEPAASHAKPRPVPNGRKGFKLTLWISPTDDNGLADAHGFVQLDGADPVPFCRLKAVPNPLARALQEAYVTIESVRAKPPHMSAPTPPQVRPTTVSPRQPSPRQAPPAVHSTEPVARPSAAKPAVSRAQPSLF
ncbi:MAG: hypothetical protein JOZ65_19035 [Chloroflexi bacterium]|nr:hypothetical protein [Chloroflexota bacterium]